MHRKSLPFALLSCVTSAETAAAIEGDLIEERAVRGKVWFAMHVTRTAFALLGVAFTRAPFRTGSLSAGGAAVSALVCLLVGRAFFGPDAIAPAPLVGLAAIVTCAVLVGVGLARVAGALGVRAAVGTALLLCIMFAMAQMLGRFEPPSGADAGLLAALGSFAVNLALAFSLYPAPLLIASACTHARRL